MKKIFNKKLYHLVKRFAFKYKNKPLQVYDNKFYIIGWKIYSTNIVLSFQTKNHLKNYNYFTPSYYKTYINSLKLIRKPYNDVILYEVAITSISGITSLQATINKSITTI